MATDTLELARTIPDALKSWEDLRFISQGAEAVPFLMPMKKTGEECSCAAKKSEYGICLTTRQPAMLPPSSKSVSQRHIDTLN